MEDILAHRRSHFTFFLLLVLCIFFLTAHLSRYVNGIKNFLFYIVNPTPQAAAQAVESLEQFSHNLSEIVRIHQDNRELRGALEKYVFLDNETAKIREENERLRSLVGFASPPRMKSIAARVIVREPGGWFQWVMIDRGKADGVRLGSPVLAWAQGRPAMLGRIAETFDHTAKVVLMTSVLSAVPVQLEESHADGLLEGQNDTRLKVNYLVTDSTTIAPGSAVVTSPLSTVFPPGILAGWVQEVTAATGETFRSLVIKPAVNLASLREVMVLIRRED